MGEQARARAERVDKWLAAGGTVVAATERAARSVISAFHAARRAEGRTAWETPAISSWESWVHDRWVERNRAGLVLLNPLQEQEFWSRVIRESSIGSDLLHAGELASAAQQAYRLLANYSPNALTTAARLGWSGDAVAFSKWLAEFEARCRREGLISASRIGLQLADSLRLEPGQIEPERLLLGDRESGRSPLLLIGFDRIQETQERILKAWGPWQRDVAGEASGSKHFIAAPDAAAELESCVAWLRGRVATDPEARLIVITTGLQKRRGKLERALLEAPKTEGPALDFEFSLGVPLGQVGVARGAILVLRWLSESLAEPEVDWLLTSGFCAASADEELALAAAMRAVRRRGQERPEWALEDFVSSNRPEPAPPLRWAARMTAAREMLARAPKRQSPLDWVLLATKLLDAGGWPGYRPLGSVAFQARQRWQAVLENCGSLGFDGSQMQWAEFLATVSAAVSATIFAAESRDAAIQITEPLESAGQLADGIWFLGVHEENWPGRGQPHPLLPIGLQRDAGMPHASPLADWKLAQEATTRLLASADEVIFSYPRHSDEAEARPSRLAAQYLGAASDVPAELTATQAPARKVPLTEVFEDASRIHFPHLVMGGGAGTLTRQSLCPFQAFATARLGAEDWQPAEAGLNAKQRGQLLHAVLHRVWGGRKSGGLSSLDELNGVADLQEFVWRIVASVMAESFDSSRGSLPDRFPARLLELEEQRLTELVSEWLAYERTRLQFKVARTEERSSVSIAGLKVQLRLDRIDELADGSLLVIDYKTGNVGPGAWAGGRPDDVQLPLYSTIAMDAESRPLEGLVFARVRPGEMKFSGRVRNATASLQAGLSARNGLVKEPLTEQQLTDWRGIIERLGEAFVAGNAEVDPKDGAKTCERCHLHGVCRVYENQPLAFVIDGDDAEDDEPGGDGGSDA